MTAMLRLLLAVALVVAGVSPASAQRGGGRGGASGGHSGGSVSASVFRGGAASIGRPGMVAAPQYRGRPVGNSPSFRMPVRERDHDFDDHRRGFAQDYRYRRTYVPFYGVGLPYNVGWVGPDFLDSSYDNSSYASAPPAASPADGYGAPSPNDYVPPPSYDQPRPMEQAEAAPSAAFRPAYQRPLPEPSAEDAVTLVFKDGRPSEQIHNYMLTQTTLYVQDQRRHQISVADIDVPATEKVNRDAGIDFQLPAGSSK